MLIDLMHDVGKGAMMFDWSDHEHWENDVYNAADIEQLGNCLLVAQAKVRPACLIGALESADNVQVRAALGDDVAGTQLAF